MSLKYEGEPDLTKCNDFMGITPSYWKCYWQISDMCENSIRRGYSRIEDLSDKLPSVFVNLLVWMIFYFSSWGRVEEGPVYIIATKPSLTLLRLKWGRNTINSKAGFHKVPPTPTLVLSSSLKIATSSIGCVSSRPRSKMLTTAGMEQVHKYKWQGSPLARKSPIQHPTCPLFLITYTIHILAQASKTKELVKDLANQIFASASQVSQDTHFSAS